MRFWLVLLVPFCLGAAAQCLGYESAVGLLVLRNGSVLSGKVTRLENHFLVEMPHGQLQVRIEQAEMFCRDLDEAYQRRREMRTGSTADSHLELARWCLRQNLLEYAAHELQAARKTDSHHRQLLQLERQLKHAIAQKENSPKVQLPREQPTHEEVEADLSAVKEVPHWARVMFVKKVQPILVKSCAASGCHSPDSENGLQLNRLAVVGGGHPGATNQNLLNVLEHVDSQNSQNSKLVLMASNSHGSEASKPLSDRQLEILRAWVEQLAIPVGSPTEPSQVVQASYETVEKSSVARLGDAFLQSKQNSKLRSIPGQTGSKSVDPFDPEIFNRRYASKTEEQREVSSAALPMNLQTPELLPAK